MSSPPVELRGGLRQIGGRSERHRCQREDPTKQVASRSTLRAVARKRLAMMQVASRYGLQVRCLTGVRPPVRARDERPNTCSSVGGASCTLMGVGQSFRVVGEAGAGPLAGEHFWTPEPVEIPRVRSCPGWLVRAARQALMGCRALSTDPLGRRWDARRLIQVGNLEEAHDDGVRGR